MGIEMFNDGLASRGDHTIAASPPLCSTYPNPDLTHTSPWMDTLDHLPIASDMDFDRVLNHLLEHICEQECLPYGEAWSLDDSGTCLICSAAWYDQNPLLQRFWELCQNFTFRLGVGLPGRIWATGEPEWMSRVDQQSSVGFLRTDMAADVGIQTMFGVPILWKDGPLAILVFGFYSVKSEDRLLVERICAIADSITPTLYHKRLQVTLRTNQKRMANLIDALPGMVFITSNDPSWSVKYLSDGCQQLTGYSSDELVNLQGQLTYNDLIDPGDLPLLLHTINRTIPCGQSYVQEYRIRTKSGAEKWLWEKGKPIIDRDGHLWGVEGFITDITGLKQTTRALEEKEAFLRLLLDNIPQQIFWKDTQLRFLGCNTSWAKEANLADPDAVVGKTDYDLCPFPEIADYYRKQDQQVLATGQPNLHILEHKVKPNGQERWLDVSKFPIRNPDGEIVGILGTIENITSRRQAEVALQESESRYRGLIDSQTDVVCRALPDTTITFINETPCRVTGNLPSDFVGQRWINTVHPDDQEMVLQALTGLTTEYPMVNLEYRNIDGFGKSHWYQWAIQGIFNSEGVLTEIQTVGRNISDRKWAEDLLTAQTKILAAIAQGTPLTQVLAAIAGLVEQQANGAKCSIMLVDEDTMTLRFGAAPSFAEAYKEAADGLVIGPYVGSCGTAAYLHQPTIVSDVTTDPRWSNYQEFARRFNIRSCWSTPILTTNGKVLGTLALSRSMPHEPANQEFLVVSQFSYLAGIAIERYLANTSLAKRERYLAALVQIQQTLLSSDQQGDLYRGVLHLLGEVTQASRCYVFENSRDQHGQLQASQRAEWCAEGITPQLENPLLQNLSYSDVSPRMAEMLAQGQPFGGIVANLLPSERQVLEPQGILSILCLPMTLKGEFFGFIGFDNCREARPWSMVEVDLLRAAVAAIALTQENKLTRQALREQEKQYRSIFENALEGIFQTTLDGRYLVANPMLARIYGYESPQALISSMDKIGEQVYVDPQRRQEFVQLLLEQGVVFDFESQIYHRDGQVIWISESARNIYDAQGQVIGFEGTVEDITARKAAEQELQRREHLLRSVADVSHHLLTNPDYEAAIATSLATLGEAAGVDRVYIYQTHPHPKTGEAAMSMRHEWTRPGIPPSINQPHWQNQSYREAGLSHWHEQFLNGYPVKGMRPTMPTTDQAILAKDDILSVLMVPIAIDGEFWGFIGFDDCTQEREWSESDESILMAIAANLGGATKRQRTAALIHYQAFHDQMTGLPNRTLFDDRLAMTLAHAHLHKDSFAVLFLDLDRFKTINDTLGHAVGDQLLQSATQRLVSCLRDGDTLARWGGDEFTLLLPKIHQQTDVAKIGDRILQVFEQAFVIEQAELYVSCSIGIAIYPQDGSDGETLLKNADAALYRAKERGRNGYEFYTPALNSQASQLLTLESCLRTAIEQQQLLLYYQPQINTTTGSISQMEALLRWQHPELGMVSPQTFMHLAEENGLILPIGEWVLATACAQAKAWQDQELELGRIAVNLSARQFQEPKLVDKVRAILERTGLPPTCLELEITETVVMQNLDFAIAMLQELQEMGVSIALDDFGTGYSSLGYLRRFPIRTLKIDRSFVQDLITDPNAAAIASAVTALGRGLNLHVVAEGVETVEQMQALRSLNCTEMQGYLFSRPLSATAATQFLRHGCMWVVETD